MKIIILLMIGVVLYCLGSGMVFLLKDIDSKRMVKALSWRVGRVIGFVCLVVCRILFWLVAPTWRVSGRIILYPI